MKSIQEVFDELESDKSILSEYWKKRDDWKEVVQTIYQLNPTEKVYFSSQYPNDSMITQLVQKIQDISK